MSASKSNCYARSTVTLAALDLDEYALWLQTTKRPQSEHFAGSQRGVEVPIKKENGKCQQGRVLPYCEQGASS